MRVRYSDIDTENKKLPPVYGYLSSPLVPLEVSLEKIIPLIDNLQRYIKTAKTHCHSSNHLTKEESAALYLYTMEWGDESFYRVLNKALRDENRAALKPWFPYLKLLDTALNKLPSQKLSLWRGVDGNVSKNFEQGQLLSWWSVNSCSSSVNIIKNFLGTDSTLFMIEAVNGKSISLYACYTTENEFILMPGTKLEVMSSALDYSGGLHIVHLREIEGDDESMSVPVSPLKLSQTTSCGLSSIVMKKKGILPDGGSYEGDTVNDIPNGRGVCVWPTGTHYTGEWKDGKKHHRGTYTYTNGDRYAGEYKGGKIHGRGICTYANGDRYDGEWQDDKKHRRGIYTYANGNRYDGEWQDGKKCGRGIYTYPNGDRYEGEYKDGKRHGQGIETCANGNRYDVKYNKGELISEKRLSA
ncbi:unnamed protein product [Didymodactylos carnosus]|uniref:NAD(P)(+)--arginine ADP-ribosyltransferase n=1 Tax=Didymodactylos carnosus TaxID=1234261 RepID=A0A815GA73_9BILA|nr:unnamed protein product [Didymodactylos carnosus]CAF1503683.1 unnamed protein product [Didymodactylos carnosus]CAF4193404.1 unnamed protein product [Didymodactylos carnosus]CAF4292065.1 unnamed protein product [Didymodactylos carnosus]